MSSVWSRVADKEAGAARVVQAWEGQDSRGGGVGEPTAPQDAVLMERRGSGLYGVGGGEAAAGPSSALAHGRATPEPATPVLNSRSGARGGQSWLLAPPAPPSALSLYPPVSPGFRKRPVWLLPGNRRPWLRWGCG